MSRLGQLDRVGPDDPDSPMRVLAELDILNAYDRMRGYYLNIAETLAGGKCDVRRRYECAACIPYGGMV